ncbi:hypothetical protein [Taklimakanibacter albus]|uniref:Uncharacterized protein n=1 Tax=Taklimakanibacter albus TaxID=2800327 RepID=A0ACC5QXQ2_9HYPH|nr:hypothetical protein [Aestuariivirga sp. YIM B02566]MBK1865175.1 hypothetical protein [Aestuariivirga sp. YIM B02566]
MKSNLAALVIFAVCAVAGGSMRGQAAETEPEIEAPGASPLGAPMQGKPARGALFCTYEDQSNAEVHVLLCRSEISEGCALTNPVPLRVLMSRYDGVKILAIGASPEGCSRVTFTGSLKTN